MHDQVLLAVPHVPATLPVKHVRFALPRVRYSTNCQQLHPARRLPRDKPGAPEFAVCPRLLNRTRAEIAAVLPFRRFPWAKILPDGSGRRLERAYHLHKAAIQNPSCCLPRFFQNRTSPQFGDLSTPPEY
ncbi:hypothetical protein D3C76_1136350 [compost metagenome]